MEMTTISILNAVAIVFLGLWTLKISRRSPKQGPAGPRGPKGDTGPAGAGVEHDGDDVVINNKNGRPMVRFNKPLKTDQ